MNSAWWPYIWKNSETNEVQDLVDKQAIDSLKLKISVRRSSSEIKQQKVWINRQVQWVIRTENFSNLIDS